MGQKVSMNNLADAIMAELEAFEEITEERFEQIAKDVAKEGVKKLKQTSPKGKGSRKGTTLMGGPLNIPGRESESFRSRYITGRSQG